MRARTGGVLFAAVMVGATFASSAVAFAAAEDDDLESAIMQMPTPATSFVACAVSGPSGRLELLDIARETGFAFDRADHDVVDEVELIVYRREWCRDDGAFVEVRGVSSEQPRTGSTFMEIARDVGGDEFAVPIADAFGSSRAVAGGTAHLVAFARHNRFFAISLYLDDPSGPALAIEIARHVEARADVLDARGGPPPVWLVVLGFVIVVGSIAAVVALIRWSLRALMRRNHAADARARGESPVAPPPPAPTSRDPLGFG